VIIKKTGASRQFFYANFYYWRNGILSNQKVSLKATLKSLQINSLESRKIRN